MSLTLTFYLVPLVPVLELMRPVMVDPNRHNIHMLLVALFFFQLFFELILIIGSVRYSVSGKK